MNSSFPSAWYVIQTKPQREEAVCSHLHRASIETFHPKIRNIGWRREHISSMFPSYVFARAALQDPYIHQLVRFTRGVTHILGMKLNPVPVQEEVIQAIKSSVGEGNVVEHHKVVVLKEGDTVQVRGGPFQDLIGVLERPVSANGRVQVLLKLMQRQIRTFLHRSQVVRYA